MLKIIKHTKILWLSSCFVAGIFSLPTPANAQFMGFKIDAAIDYSAAPAGVSGGSIGIIHPVPFIPNIGYSSVSFEDTESIINANDNSKSITLTTITSIKTINFFYYVPFPVVTISVGIGFGQDNLNTGMEVKTTIEETNENTDNSDLKTSVAESFVHIGLPFWNTIEFHLGYHLMSVSSIDRTSKKSRNLDGYPIEKKDYTGGMTTVGVQIAF